MNNAETTQTEDRHDFIRDIVRADLEAGRCEKVVTRFPPEPNGYLHIGHAKSMCLNFGIAEEFAGRCHLRFDDTNPAKEEHEFIDSIQTDVHWLGFDWGKHLYFASDNFETLYDWACHLIQGGHAYVAELLAKAQLRRPDLRIAEAPYISRGRAIGDSHAIKPMAVIRAVHETYKGAQDVGKYREKMVRRYHEEQERGQQPESFFPPPTRD